MPYFGSYPGVCSVIGSGVNPLEDATRDGPNKQRIPVSAAEFQILKLPVPDYLWLCQDTSGDLAATIGTALPAEGAGTHLYQQSLTGWSRKAIGSQTDNTVVNWRFTAGNGPLPTTGSVVWFGLFQFLSLPAASRIFINAAATPTTLRLNFTSAGLIVLNVAGVTTTGAYNYVDGAVHPVVLVYNKTTGVAEYLTDKERIVGTYSASISDSTKGIGQTGAQGTNIWRCGWLSAYTGTNAERNWRDVLHRLNWQMTY